MLPTQDGDSRWLQRTFKWVREPGWFVVTVWLACGSAWAAENVPVHCPALWFEKPVQINGPGGPFYPTTLIALGTIKAVAGPVARPRRATLEIEEVLHGDRGLKRVEIESDWGVGKRAIFFLAPTGHADGPEYEEDHTWQPEEAPVARVLAAARFAELVLNASSIFIGEDTNEHPEKWKETNGPATRVKVLTNLSGRKLPVNEAVEVDRMPHRFPGPQIYILHGAGYQRPKAPTLYSWKGILPLQLKDEVMATLAKRDQYPLVENPSDSSMPRYREYVFSGSAQEALNLLASENDAMEVLAKRYFYHHPKDARELLAPLITKALLQTEETREDEFRLQRRRIYALGLAERKTPAGTMAALAEKLIASLEASPAPVPIPEKRNRQTDDRNFGGSGDEEETVDVNHSLAWLLLQLPEQEASERWGERLLGLSLRLTGWWQQEVALAADVLRLGVARDLEAARARMKSVAPVRSTEALPTLISKVYFSADHRRLWTFEQGGSYSHWDAETMKMMDHQLPPPGSVQLSASLRDGQYLLYVQREMKLPEIAAPLKVSATSVESGKRLPTIELSLSERSRIGWLAGGQFVVTNGQTIALVDAIDGKILRQVAYAKRESPCYISPDRHTVLTGDSWKGQEHLEDKIDLTTGEVTHLAGTRSPVDEGTYEPLVDQRAHPGLGPLDEGWPKRRPNLRGHQIWQIGSSADRKRMAILTQALEFIDGEFRDRDQKAPIIVRIYDSQSLRMIAAVDVPGPTVGAYLNRDGSQLVVVHDAKTMERWPIPE